MRQYRTLYLRLFVAVFTDSILIFGHFEAAHSSQSIRPPVAVGTDPLSLSSTLTQAISTTIQTISSGGAIATVAQPGDGSDLLIRTAFESMDPINRSKFVWRGHLEVFWPLTRESGESEPDALCPNKNEHCYDFDLARGTSKLCKDMQFGHCWDAATILRDRLNLGRSDRTIFAGYDANGNGKISTGESISFDPRNAETLRQFLRLPEERDTSEEAARLIRWVRGEPLDSYRKRDGWVLGDIVYSSPVVVGAPALGGVSPQDPNVREYWAYRNEVLGQGCEDGGTKCPPYSRRKKMIYVGANDGMLHAFVMSVWDDKSAKWLTKPTESPEIGKELWAYIPSNLLPRLKDLADPSYGAELAAHQSMVDLSPRAWDVYITDPSNPLRRTWRTVVIGGERGGGDTYFALDVTDPDHPILLWEYSVTADRVVIDLTSGSPKALTGFSPYEKGFRNLPFTWSIPYVGRVKLPSGLRFFTGPPRNFQPTGDFAPSDRRRHVAFVGGGSRLFDPAVLGTTASSPDILNHALFDPYFLAIDVETGQNLFKYVWPYMVAKNRAKFPLEHKGSHIIPYALSAPLCLDLVHESSGAQNPDGFTDHIYVGDLMGNFYAMKLRSDLSHGPFLTVDVRKTKRIAGKNRFRGSYQPITTMPAASLSEDQGFLRVVFGTGKYDDVNDPGGDDKSDMETMSLYNLKTHVDLLPNSGATEEVFNSRVSYQLQFKCPGVILGNNCSWSRKGSDDGDCCQGSPIDECPETSCFSCVYDFGRGSAYDTATKRQVFLLGERVTEKPLIAGGLIFATTYVPPNNLVNIAGNNALGNAFLYAFDYECKYFQGGFNPFNEVIVGKPAKPSTSDSSGSNSGSSNTGNSGSGGQGPGDSGPGSGGSQGPGNDPSGRTGGPDDAAASGGWGDTSLLPNRATGNGQDLAFGARMSLGHGVPSSPVMETSGLTIDNQVGGDFRRVGVQTKTSIFRMKGWRLR